MDCSLAPICGSESCPAQLACLTTVIIPRVVYASLAFVGIVALAMIIFAGFKYITSQADKKTLESAQKTLIFAIIGIAFVLFSFLIINVIGEATGVTCIEPQNVLLNGLNSCQ